MIYEDMPFASIPERHQGAVKEVTELYCAWLNKFNEQRGNEDNAVNSQDFKYTADWFLNKEVNEFANVVVRFCRDLAENEDADDHMYMELSMGNGDDGGPATLFVHAEREWHTEETGNTINSHWDQWTQITKFGGPGELNEVKTFDEPIKHPVTYPQTRQVWDDKYEIRLITQTFDSYYTTVYLNERGGGTDAEINTRTDQDR